jgi:hypothetical protein
VKFATTKSVLPLQGHLEMGSINKTKPAKRPRLTYGDFHPNSNMVTSQRNNIHDTKMEPLTSELAIDPDRQFCIPCAKFYTEEYFKKHIMTKKHKHNLRHFKENTEH